MPEHAPDPLVERLATLFREHEAWIEAARHLDSRATSSVYFSHVPGQAWQLRIREDRAQLLRGGASDPDLVFRFTPGAIERLERLRGGIGDFAVELFTLMLEDDPALQVGFRIVAGFPRLAVRGYVRLLLAAGPRVVVFGATHGIGSLVALRRFVAQLRTRSPASWETDAERP